MGRGIRKVTVIGIGTPPPLPLRPIVDEVLRAWDAKQRAQGRPDGGQRRPLRPVYWAPDDRVAAARSTRGSSKSADQVGADPLG